VGTLTRVLDDDERRGDEERDEDLGEEEPAPPTPIRRFEQSAVGVVLSAGMLGLRDVLEGPRDEEVEIVTDWSGDPPFTDPYVLRLDPDHPEDSIVMVRPWLRHNGARRDRGDG